MAGSGRTGLPQLPDGEDSGTFLKSFGRQVKLFRERAGLTQPELAARLLYGPDLIGSVEQGKRIPKPELIDKADEVLDAGGILRAMKGEVARARYPAFFRDVARFEADALELHVYANQAVPGVLQTEEYARAVLAMRRPLIDEEIIEERLAARMARQEIFSRRPAPLMSFVIEEVVLHRPYGGKAAMQAQLEQLLRLGQKRNVEIQVMPTEREDHAGADGPFSLLLLNSGEQLAYLEVQGHSVLHTKLSQVQPIASRYGIIRAQALTPGESLVYIEKLLGEL